MVKDKDKFQDLVNINSKLNLASDDTTIILGKGSISLHVNERRKIKLTNVLYVPKLRANLLSVGKIAQNHNIIFFKNKAVIKNYNNEIVFVAHKKNGLYQVNLYNDNEQANLSEKNETLKLWHNRLGHVNKETLKDLIKNNQAKGIKVKNLCDDENKCEICIQGKHSQQPFPKKSTSRSRDALDLIHCDICGPMNIRSAGGARYFITFIDDATRWCDVYFLKHKSEALEIFKTYKSKVENDKSRHIKSLRTDNGKEFMSKDFSHFLQKAGIHHQTSVEYTPQQNGVAERKNRTLVEMARCMIIQSKLPNYLWAEAISTANYIRNRVPSNSLNGKIPYTLWRNREPNLKHLRTFGTLAYVLQKGPKKGKFNAKSIPCYLMGYSEEAKAYRLWEKTSSKILKSRDVIFVNEGIYINNIPNVISLDDEISKNNEWFLEGINKKENENKVIENNSEENIEEGKEATNEKKDNVMVQNILRKRGRPRIIRDGTRGRPKKQFITEVKNIIENNDDDNGEMENSLEKYFFEDNANESEDEYSFLSFNNDPKSIKDIINDPYRKEWEEAINEELRAHKENNTWDIVEKPTGVKIVDSKWVFNSKFNENGHLIKRKARLVAKGFSQRPGLDYHETYSPVAKLRSIRLIIAIAIQFNLHIRQFDITTAYLNGELDKPIYMKIPDYFELCINKGNLFGNKVLKLNKALYGLKQSGRLWYEKFDNVLQKLGFQKMEYEPCIYKYEKEDKFLILALYVDDIILASKCENGIEFFVRNISNVFEIKIIGQPTRFLGIEMTYVEDNSVILYQKEFIKKLLKKFSMEDCNPVQIPMDPNVKLCKEMCPKNDDERKKLQHVPYQKLVGSLLYLSITTRPDIAYVVNVLSQYNNNFGMAHWKAAKRVLKYLKFSMNLGLHFRKTVDDIQGFADADWAANTDDRRSYSGYFFKMCNSCIFWETKRQKTVALSTAEAEYISLAEATKEAVYLQNLMDEIGIRDMLPVRIFNDNKSAQMMAKNPIVNNRSKHIDIKHHFIRNMVAENKVNIEYIPTESMPADMLTKPLVLMKFNNCLELLCMKKFE